MAKVVLAFSGSVDTNICLHWLKHKKGYKVVTFSAVLGPMEVPERLGEQAVELGATAAHLADLRERFAEEFVLPSFRAKASYGAGYLLFAALARPLLAAELVRIANEEGCEAIAHGSRGLGSDRVRFERSVEALSSGLRVISPLHELGLKTPAGDFEYARQNGIPMPEIRNTIYNLDVNVWGASIQLGGLKDPWSDPPRSTYIYSVPFEEAPDKPLELEIGFEEGRPVSLDGKKLPLAKLIETLNPLVGRHAVGRQDVVEDRISGIKVREIYDAPAASFLYTACGALEQITLERSILDFKEGLGRKYGELVYDGYWYSDLRRALDAFFSEVQKPVTGKVRARIYKGTTHISERQSPRSLYHPEIVSFDAEPIVRHTKRRSRVGN